MCGGVGTKKRRLKCSAMQLKWKVSIVSNLRVAGLRAHFQGENENISNLMITAVSSFFHFS